MKTNARLSTTRVFLASCCLMLKHAAPTAYAQLAFVTEEEEGAVSMSGLSCDRNYIVCICLGRQTTSITPLTSIFKTQSRIDRSRELLMTSCCTGTASSRLPRRGRTRRPQGRFMILSKKACTHLEGRQHQRRQREDRLFDTGETLEFPVGMFLRAWQPRTGLAA
jgi:hypothetical protein